MTFTLHSQLERDTISLGNFTLCRLLLLNNKTVPWFILVPERAGVTELFELLPADKTQFHQESDQLSQQIKSCFHADKLNIASIGNIVPQLHIHHIVRYKNDPLWPNVVWGNVTDNPYDQEETQQIMDTLMPNLQDFSCEPFDRR